MRRKSITKAVWRYIHPTTGKVVLELEIKAAHKNLVDQAMGVCSVELRDRLDKKLGVQPR